MLPSPEPTDVALLLGVRGRRRSFVRLGRAPARYLIRAHDSPTQFRCRAESARSAGEERGLSGNLTRASGANAQFPLGLPGIPRRIVESLETEPTKPKPASRARRDRRRPSRGARATRAPSRAPSAAGAT